MRTLSLLGLMVVLLSGVTGCGQTGALIKASDPHQDHRSRYLLYKNTTSVTPEQQTPVTLPSSDSELGQQP